MILSIIMVKNNVEGAIFMHVENVILILSQIKSQNKISIKQGTKQFYISVTFH